MDERQEEELEALKAIFDEDFTVIGQTPLTVMVCITESSLQEKLGGKLNLKVIFTPTYPDEMPTMEVPVRSKILDRKQHKELMTHLSQTASDCIGDAMVYQLVEAGREFLENLELNKDSVNDRELWLVGVSSTGDSGTALLSLLTEDWKHIASRQSGCHQPGVATFHTYHSTQISRWHLLMGFFPLDFQVMEGPQRVGTIHGEEEILEVEEILQPVELADVKVTGGKWDFVIGLVGKPSAGKSTFFNAATGFDSAKTAAHPFTTIDPNIGRGFYTIPCPCAKMPQLCDAAYGHNWCGKRLQPVKLKDVAGLVPGACDGRGRGNRFLNDLLDADVLIHVVDASGMTDENGEAAEGYDPANDVKWLHEEIHRWIYDNVMLKWDSIRKRPQRLIDMFTGYHATKATIHAALAKAGIDEQELANLSNWSENVLHRIVKTFLTVRFPIFLVLNKADTPSAAVNIERLKVQYPDMSMAAVSARSECVLQQLSKSALIAYECGSPSISTNEGLTPVQLAEVDTIQTGVFSRYGSTNVHSALSAAVQLRNPEHVFPVQCLDTFTSIDKYRDHPPGVLRDSICIKPHTTVHEVYTALNHYPLYLLAGDFIRAEASDELGQKKIVRKEEVVSSTNAILKIITNRKVSQIKAKDIIT